jgi:hypothetical protein
MPWTPVSYFYPDGSGVRQIRLSFSALIPRPHLWEGIARLAAFTAEEAEEAEEADGNHPQWPHAGQVRESGRAVRAARPAKAGRAVVRSYSPSWWTSSTEAGAAFATPRLTLACSSAAMPL